MNKIKQVYVAIKAGIKLAMTAIKIINKLTTQAEDLVKEVDQIVEEVKEVLAKHI